MAQGLTSLFITKTTATTKQEMMQARDFWAQVGGNKSSNGGFYSVFSLLKSGKETAHLPATT